MDIWLYLTIGLPFGMLAAYMSNDDPWELSGPVFGGFFFWLLWPLVLLLVICFVPVAPFIWIFYWLSEKGEERRDRKR